MKCPNGHEVNSRAKFCPICGAGLRGTRYCSNCGCELNGNEGVCPQCGITFNAQETNADDVDNYQSNKTLKISLSIVAIIIIGVGAWSYMSKGEGVASSNETGYTQAVDSNEDITTTYESVENGDDFAERSETYHSEPSYDEHESSSDRKFLNAQYVVGYLANQTFTNYSNVDIKFDGDGRIYIDGDCAGVVSVLRYDETSAILRYGGGMYGEGKILVNIENDRLRLSDPVDGTTWYQK